MPERARQRPERPGLSGHEDFVPPTGGPSPRSSAPARSSSTGRCGSGQVVHRRRRGSGRLGCRPAAVQPARQPGQIVTAVVRMPLLERMLTRKLRGRDSNPHRLTGERFSRPRPSEQRVASWSGMLGQRAGAARQLARSSPSTPATTSSLTTPVSMERRSLSACGATPMESDNTVQARMPRAVNARRPSRLCRMERSTTASLLPFIAGATRQPIARLRTPAFRPEQASHRRRRRRPQFTRKGKRDPGPCSSLATKPVPVLVGLQHQLQDLGRVEVRRLHVGHLPCGEGRLDLAAARPRVRGLLRLGHTSSSTVASDAATALTSRPIASRWALFRPWKVPVSNSNWKSEPTRPPVVPSRRRERAARGRRRFSPGRARAAGPSRRCRHR